MELLTVRKILCACLFAIGLAVWYDREKVDMKLRWNGQGLERHWRQVNQRRMKALAIVENFNVFKDFRFRLVHCRKITASS